MFLSKFVEYICCIKACIVTQLPGYDFQCLGVTVDEQLSLAWDSTGIVTEGTGQLRQQTGRHPVNVGHASLAHKETAGCSSCICTSMGEGVHHVQQGVAVGQ